MKTELTLTFTISDFEEHKDLDLDFIKMEFINNIHDSVRKKKFSDKLNKPFGTDFKVTKIRIDKW
jgi:hypothetical protein